MGAPVRIKGWQTRLEALVNDRLHRRFEFGVHDCCLWAADVVLAATGTDPAEGLRGTYNDEQSAQAVIESMGGVPSIGASRFGDEIAVSLAQSGDVGMIDTDSGPALVAKVGTTWMAATAWGVSHIADDSVMRAWRAV